MDKREELVNELSRRQSHLVDLKYDRKQLNDRINREEKRIIEIQDHIGFQMRVPARFSKVMRRAIFHNWKIWGKMKPFGGPIVK